MTMLAEENPLIEVRGKRDKMIADTTIYPFLNKYLEREFDRDIDKTPFMEEFLPWSYFAPVLISDESASVTESMAAMVEEGFLNICRRSRVAGIVLRLPNFVIGTGMTGLPRTLARGVARGTMLKIKDNEAEVSAVHAVDVARVARILAESNPTESIIVSVPGVTVKINDLISALGVRIKDKRVGTIKPRWARILYGSSLYRDLTTSAVYDDTAVKALLPEDYVFENPVFYLEHHIYDHESL